MAFNTGLFWLHTGAGLTPSVSYSGATPQAIGVVKTNAALDADISDNKIAVVETGGAKAIFIKPLVASAGNGTATTATTLDVYGVMGFGEPMQTDYTQYDKFLWALGTIVLADASDGGVAANSGDIFTSPGGTQFKSFAGCGTGGDLINSVFSSLSAMNTSPPDVEDLDHEDTDGASGVGFAIVPGIDVFSQVIISFTLGGLNTSDKANALINLHY